MTTTTDYGHIVGTTLTDHVGTALGEYAADFDVPAIVEAYRAAIQDVLPDGVTIHGEGILYGPSRAMTSTAPRSWSSWTSGPLPSSTTHPSGELGATDSRRGPRHIHDTSATRTDELVMTAPVCGTDARPLRSARPDWRGGAGLISAAVVTVRDLPAMCVRLHREWKALADMPPGADYFDDRWH